MERFVGTSVDAYRDYPLFEYAFGKGVDERTMTRMMSVDLRSRKGMMAGLYCGDDFESIVVMEAPKARKVGPLQFIKTVKLSELDLLFKLAVMRQGKYENFAIKKREPYIDENTWYFYIFATKKKCQGMGYGKKLLSFLLSFADSRGCKICLETDLSKNVSLYEHFGFTLMDKSLYKGSIEHYVMRYGG